jgi:16S rRNA (guanine527-N7)-methyltransferase
LDWELLSNKDTSLTDILREGLAKLCENDTDTAALINPRFETVVSLLEKHIAEIELFNGAYGLVGSENREELVIRHILDSLAPLGIISRLFAGQPLAAPAAQGRTPAGLSAPAIADAGSGAGLPGIPLAICLPGAHITLIERMGRRAGFLRNTLAILGLPNLEVEEREMEKAEAGRFDLLVFRAFRPLEPPVYRALRRLLRNGAGPQAAGTQNSAALAAYKGRASSITAEMRALETALGTQAAKSGQRRMPTWEALPCPVPFLDEERHLVVIRG